MVAPPRPAHFLFSLDGTLVALPVERRQKVTDERTWSWMNPSPVTPADLIAGLLARYEEHLDEGNRPVGEAQEGLLAWLGLELQPMNPDLARLNKVSDQTSGGTTGAIVTYVYDGSPAAEADIWVGDILLRLHIVGQPTPLEVTVAE